MFGASLWECLANQWEPVTDSEGTTAWSGQFKKHFEEGKGLLTRDPAQVPKLLRRASIVKEL